MMVYFVCQVGLVTAALGAARIQKRLEEAGAFVYCRHVRPEELPEDAAIVVCRPEQSVSLGRRAPQADLLVVNSFLNDPALERLVETLSRRSRRGPEMLPREAIRLGQRAESCETAIRAVGKQLYQLGCVEESYIDAMLAREALATTNIGMGVAVPHGLVRDDSLIRRSGAVLFQYPDGVLFGGEPVQLVFGIAGIGEEHLNFLSQLCTMLEDERTLETCRTTDDPDAIWRLFAHGAE